MEEDNLKIKTARTIKWNTIEKLSSQILYAITGIVLANVLSKEDFGLVGSILVFQAFANLFVDSGFSNALIQRKNPTQTDYSTVFYFNLLSSIAIYILLWIGAPLIADIFHDTRLIDLSRVMFLTFILNATAIVQTNRLMKQMNVKMIAVSNTIALTVSGIAGIALALTGFGAWAIVWQSIILASLKSLILWVTTKWTPGLTFSTASLKSIFAVGSGVMATSFLNTIFLNIYSFIIGAYYSLSQLGLYTQADKWSKMGIASLSQIITASFLPVMSEFQDDKERFMRALAKTNRFTAYILFPCFGLLFVAAEPIFHLLFSTKWDAAILLFQILLLRGIFTVLTSLYNNYILSIGRTKILVYSEIIKDALTIIAIFATIKYDIYTLIWGQLIAGALYYIISIYLTAKVTQYPVKRLIADIIPYLGITIISLVPAMAILHFSDSVIIILAVQFISGFGIYFIINYLLKSKIQQDALEYALGRFRNKKTI
ncbi:MAG: lipopolysaccharide biosynthesis protein [Muribaculaceae bacterium]|nr:lipopolysaccharide biosynthesis protein [Muribaculaceae bacterium]